MPAQKSAALSQNVAKQYRNPFEILKDYNLSEDEKRKALQEWEADQKALLRADDESIPPHIKKETPQPADMLKKVQGAERELEKTNPLTKEPLLSSRISLTEDTNKEK